MPNSKQKNNSKQLPMKPTSEATSKEKPKAKHKDTKTDVVTPRYASTTNGYLRRKELSNENL